jgi:glutaredoxin
MSSRRSTLPVLSVLLASLFAAVPAHALYKVVGPDGKITYTDQPPTDTQNKVQPVKSGPGSGAAASNLPYELRQIVQRYPVVLYATATCAPCDSGRQLLQERGIPYTERVVGATREDNEALARLTGGGGIPSLSVGGQVLRGFLRDDWSSYLDLAGYPKTSQLPNGYVAQKQPLLERNTPAPAAQPSAPAPAPQTPAPAPAATPDNPSGIRF